MGPGTAAQHNLNRCVDIDRPRQVLDSPNLAQARAVPLSSAFAGRV